MSLRRKNCLFILGYYIRAIFFAVLFGAVNAIEARALYVSPQDPSYFDPNRDAARDWDWTDPAWYLSTHNVLGGIAYPFDPNGYVGDKEAGDYCRKDQNWVLYIRRILEDDGIPVGIDPLDRRPIYPLSSHDPAVPTPLSATPYFVIYNLLSGEFRYFIFLNPDIVPARADFISAAVSVANPSQSMLSTSKILTRTTDSRFDYTDLGNIRQSKADNQLVVTKSTGVSAVRGRWFTFAFKASYDPNLFDEREIYFFKVGLTFHSSEQISLQGSVNGTIDQVLPKLNGGVEPSWWDETVQTGKIIKSSFDAGSDSKESFEKTFSSGSSQIASYKSRANEISTRTYWRASNWPAAGSVISKSVRGAVDVSGSVAGALQKVATFSSPAVPYLSAATAIITSGSSLGELFSSKEPDPPIPLKFDVQLTAQLDGTISWQSSTLPIFTQISGLGLNQSGSNTVNLSQYPYFAKAFGNGSTGLLYLKAPIPVEIHASRQGNGLPSFYAYISNPRRYIELNPLTGERILDLQARLYQINSFQTDWASKELLGTAQNIAIDFNYSQPSLSLYEQDESDGGERVMGYTVKSATQCGQIPGQITQPCAFTFARDTRYEPLFANASVDLLLTTISRDGKIYSRNIKVLPAITFKDPLNSITKTYSGYFAYHQPITWPGTTQIAPQAIPNFQSFEGTDLSPWMNILLN